MAVTVISPWWDGEPVMKRNCFLAAAAVALDVGKIPAAVAAFYELAKPKSGEGWSMSSW
jgi:hypothetical protein